MKGDVKSLSEKLEISEKQLSDQVNSFHSKLEEKEVLLDKQINLLKTTTEDLAKAKGALVTCKDFLRLKEDKLVNLEKSFEDLTSKNDQNVSRLQTLEDSNQKLQSENVKIVEDLKTFKTELSQKTEAIQLKEEEIVQLKNLVDRDESELKVRK